MKDRGSGIRLLSRDDHAELAASIRMTQIASRAYFQPAESEPARLLAAARALINEAQRIAAIDGGPRFTETR